MATKKVNEENEVKEATPKKTTTRKRTTTKKTEEKKMTLADIPQDLIAELTKQIVAQINTNSTNVGSELKEVKEVEKEPIMYDLSYFYAHPEVCKERVKVTSIVENVNYVSDVSGYKWKWRGIGTPQYLTIEELINMENSSQRFLHTPWLRVHDDRLVEAFELKELYENLDKTEDLNKFFSLSDSEITRLLNSFSRMYVFGLISRIQKAITSGKLKADYRVIRLIEKITRVTIYID